MLQELTRSIKILVRLYYLRHGFEAVDSLINHYLSLLTFMTYAAIESHGDPTSLQSLQSTIVLVTLGLRDQSQSYYLGHLVFKAVRGGMRAEEGSLIDRLIGHGRGVGKHPPKEWQAQSIWAVDFGSIVEDVEKRTLSQLLKNSDDAESAL